MPTINGIANWAFTSRPDQFGNYTITVDVDEAFIEVLKEGKVKAKIEEIDHAKQGEVHDPNKAFKFNFRRKQLRADGTENGPPEVYDSAMNPLSTKVLIGNGSEVNIQYDTYTYDNDTRTAIVLEKVQVVKLIPYEREVKNELTAQAGGFVADDSGVI